MIDTSSPQKAAPASQVASASLLTKVEALITKVDGIAKSDALKAKGVVEKYWPIAVGVLIAATRFL